MIRASCYSDRQNFAFSGGGLLRHILLFFLPDCLNFICTESDLILFSTIHFNFFWESHLELRIFFRVFPATYIILFIIYCSVSIYVTARCTFLCVHLTLCDCEMRSLCQTCSSLKFTVTQWLEHPTSVRKVVGSIPIWNSQIVSEFFSPHISFYLSVI